MRGRAEIRKEKIPKIVENIPEAIVTDFFSSSNLNKNNNNNNNNDDDRIDRKADNKYITHIIIAGSSAGGLATYLHANQIIDWTNQTVYDAHDKNNNINTSSNNYDHSNIEFGLFVDSGFFRDWDEVPAISTTVDSSITNSSRTSYSDWTKSIYILNNATDTLPSDCLSEQNHDQNHDQQQYYRCMFAKNVIPFLTVPYFAIKSKFDEIAT